VCVCVCVCVCVIRVDTGANRGRFPWYDYPTGLYITGNNSSL